jgi:hypothetical protein
LESNVSDIGLNFPFWFIAAYFVVVGWYVSVPAIVVLGLVGCFVDMARGWRVAAFGTAALLSAPLVVYAVLTINDNAKYKRFRAEMHRTLDHDETITGLALPAGSDIDFTDKSRTQIRSVDLPVVTDPRRAGDGDIGVEGSQSRLAEHTCRRSDRRWLSVRGRLYHLR